MAPAAVTVAQLQEDVNNKLSLKGSEKKEAKDLHRQDIKDFNGYKNVYNVDRKLSEDGRYLTLLDDEVAELNYPAFAPSWDLQEKQPPYQEVKFEDKLALADPTYPNLFKDSKVELNDLTPKFGTEVKNLQLSQLTNEQKNELALFVAKRGVAVFRNQDLLKHGPEFAVNFASYYGELHSHPTSGAPKGYPALHLVYKGKKVTPGGTYLARRINSLTWHSDVTYELQPPSITFLGLLQGPKSGGDTVFVDTVEAYNRLSPKFREYLETLTAKHSGFEQAQAARDARGHIRREPVAHSHPVVRRIAATGDKLIYVNPQFTREIDGLKVEESENILNFLYNFLGSSVDIQARAKWEPDTIVVWDNRRALHSALFDWDGDEVRHVYRLAARLEKPTI